MSRRATLLFWQILCAAIEDIRTLYAQKDPELLQILEDITKIEIRLGVRPADQRRAA